MFLIMLSVPVSWIAAVSSTARTKTWCLRFDRAILERRGEERRKFWGPTAPPALRNRKAACARVTLRACFFAQIWMNSFDFLRFRPNLAVFVQKGPLLMFISPRLFRKRALFAVGPPRDPPEVPQPTPGAPRGAWASPEIASPLHTWSLHTSPLHPSSLHIVFSHLISSHLVSSHPVTP